MSEPGMFGFVWRCKLKLLTPLNILKSRSIQHLNAIYPNSLKINVPDGTSNDNVELLVKLLSLGDYELSQALSCLLRLRNCKLQDQGGS